LCKAASRKMSDRSSLPNINSLQTPRAHPLPKQSFTTLVPESSRSIRCAIRRPQLRQIVPLADTTIYELEQRGEFPRRFYLTPRCVVWDLAEVEAWLEKRQQASYAETSKAVPAPDVRLRKRRPVRSGRV